jgi:hypothetical protein
MPTLIYELQARGAEMELSKGHVEKDNRVRGMENDRS